MHITLKDTDEQLRQKIEKILSGRVSEPIQVATVWSRLARPHHTPGSPHVPDLSPQDRGRSQDIIWDLIIEGHLRPGGGDGQNNEMPFFHITPKGREYFAKSSS